jgi:hypothetical protein
MGNIAHPTCLGTPGSAVEAVSEPGNVLGADLRQQRCIGVGKIPPPVPVAPAFVRARQRQAKPQMRPERRGILVQVLQPAIIPIASRTSSAAVPRCGSRVTFSSAQRRGDLWLELVDIKPAPAIRPDCSAAISAASSTTSPRAMLIRMPCGRMRRQRARVDQMARPGPARHGDHHEIRQRHQPRPGRPGARAPAGVGGRAVVEQDLHAEAEMQRRAMALPIRPMPMMPTVLPVTWAPASASGASRSTSAAAQQPLALARAARGHQDQRQRDIGGGIGHGAGGVGHRDAGGAGGRHVDMVEAHAEIRQQPRAGRHIGKGPAPKGRPASA